MAIQALSSCLPWYAASHRRASHAKDGPCTIKPLPLLRQLVTLRLKLAIKYVGRHHCRHYRYCLRRYYAGPARLRCYVNTSLACSALPRHAALVAWLPAECRAPPADTPRKHVSVTPRHASAIFTAYMCVDTAVSLVNSGRFTITLSSSSSIERRLVVTELHIAFDTLENNNYHIRLMFTTAMAALLLLYVGCCVAASARNSRR